MVMSVKPDLKVYRVKDSLTGRERVVHRNLYSTLASCPVRKTWTVDLLTREVTLQRMEVIYALMCLT